MLKDRDAMKGRGICPQGIPTMSPHPPARTLDLDQAGAGHGLGRGRTSV